MDHEQSQGAKLHRSASVVDNSASRSRLSRSTSVADGSGIARVAARWKPTPEQKHILETIYNSGTRHPSLERVNEITIHLQRYGRVEGKNVFYWFQNFHAREKRKKDKEEPKGSKWPAMFRSKNWTSLFRSKKPSHREEEKEEEEEEEEEVTSDPRRNSSMAASDLRTLELFPLQSDRGNSSGWRQ